ncbi:MAG TPA: cation:proton antiporter [Candidatus Nanoarchaeia archaeon]|nr:cation:proton antiporter [Candidatus Nanoarchaeia archaeon]
MINPLIFILISLGLAYFLAEIVKKLGLPRVVGQISAGLVLGIPLIRKYLSATDNLEILSFLANLGIVLLFYYVGLETDFRAVTKNIQQSVLISLFNTTIPLIIGFLMMKFLFEFSTLVSLIIGISLSVSAQSVSLDILEELKLIKSKIGSLIISAGAVDDAIEIILVGILFSIFHVAGSDLTLITLFVEIVIFLVIVVIARVWLIPYSLKFFDRQKSTTARFTGALLLVLLIASFAEFLGVGLLIGAMIAGILVKQTIFKDEKIPNWEEHDIAKSIHLISFGFLIPLFFVSVGLKVDFSSFIQEFWFVLLLLLISIIGTVGGSLIAVLIHHGKFKDGIILGWGLSPKGDVELVIATLALTNGIISINIFTSLVMMALLTTILSPIIFKKLLGIHKSKKLS